MSTPITSDLLHNAVTEGKEKRDDAMRSVLMILGRFREATPMTAFEYLGESGLIRLPVDAPSFGGGIFEHRKVQVPFLNTAVPRIQEIFNSYVMLYHILYNDVKTPYTIENRFTQEDWKAQFFACGMLVQAPLRKFDDSPYTSFSDRILSLMNFYHVPYRAVLIALYEDCLFHERAEVRHDIESAFDSDPSDLVSRFDILGLDSSLVSPSNIINAVFLERRIRDSIDDDPDIDTHRFNLEFFNETVSKCREYRGDQ